MALNFIEMLLLISISGAFGGLISSIMDCEINVQNLSHFNYFCRLIGRSLVGIAGAFGIILIGLWIGKITDDASVLNEIFIISLCIIGGTFSLTMLPKIGRKLEQQLQLQITETQKAVEKIEKKSDDQKYYSLAMLSAESALNTKNISDVKLAIERLNAIKDKYPVDRTLHIYLGRLYRILNNYNQAIMVLRQFIDNLDKENATIVVNPHYYPDKADAYYNIACYHTLKAAEIINTGPQSEVDRLIGETIDALKISIKIFPENLNSALNDSDFDLIKDDTRFKTLYETLSEDNR